MVCEKGGLAIPVVASLDESVLSINGNVIHNYMNNSIYFTLYNMP